MRLVKYFPTRVVIDYDQIFDREGCVLVVLPRPAISLIRTFSKYMLRSINYRVTQNDDTTYVALSDDDNEFKSIIALVGEMEHCLMSFCDITAILDELELMRACICAMSQGNVTESEVTAYLQNVDLLTYSETMALDEVALPDGDTARCEFANTAYGYLFQQISEVWLPLAEVTTSVLAFCIGITPTFVALTGGLGIAPAVGAVLFSAAIAFLADYLTTNITNWLVGNHQELVCEIFNNAVESYQSIASACVEYINADESLSAGDKMMLRFVFGQRTTYQSIQDAIDNARIDPDDYAEIECTECGTPEGCWTMCHSGWTIEACGTLENCQLTNGCSTGAILASHPVSVSGNFELGLYVNRPYDSAYNFDIRVYQEGSLVFQWRPITDAGESYMSTETTGVTEGDYEIRLYGINGTPYVVSYVCAIE